jgi:hypothetical protein
MSPTDPPPEELVAAAPAPAELGAPAPAPAELGAAVPPAEELVGAAPPAPLVALGIGLPEPAPVPPCAVGLGLPVLTTPPLAVFWLEPEPDGEEPQATSPAAIYKEVD